MIQNSNLLRASVVSLLLVAFLSAATPNRTPTIERILREQFPTQQTALVETTQSLLEEYRDTKKIAALIFYAYAMLKQADYFVITNDVVNASEYAKTGFFYLDEAVELNENALRIRYLRAKVDAYLPPVLGRCVIAIEDTGLLLTGHKNFSREINSHVINMRYSSLVNCNKHEQARQFLAQYREAGTISEIKSAAGETSSWDSWELKEIILPIMEGD